MMYQKHYWWMIPHCCVECDTSSGSSSSSVHDAFIPEENTFWVWWQAGSNICFFCGWKPWHSNGVLYTNAVQTRKRYCGWKKRNEFFSILQRIVKIQIWIIISLKQTEGVKISFIFLLFHGCILLIIFLDSCKMTSSLQTILTYFLAWCWQKKIKSIIWLVILLKKITLWRRRKSSDLLAFKGTITKTSKHYLSLIETYSWNLWVSLCE